MTQGLETYLTHLRSSSSPRASPSLHQDHLVRSRIEPNISTTARSTADRKELDDPEGKREDSTRESHSKSRNARQKIRQPLDDPPPAGLPPVRQDIDSETQTDEYYDPDRRPDEFANFIRNQSLNEGIELDSRFHARSEYHSETFQVSTRKEHAGSSKLTAREQLEGPYTIHCFEDGWGRQRASHTLGDCRMFTELSNNLKEEKQREAKRVGIMP